MPTIFCHDSPTPHTFHSRSVMFRCLNPSCQGRRPDPVYGASRNITPPPVLGMAFAPQGRWARSLAYVRVPTGLVCPACRLTSTMRICPICHGALPDAQLDHPIVSLVGGTTVGKTCYLTVSIHLLPQLVSQFGYSGYVLDESTGRWTRLRQLLRKGQGILPPQTVSGQTEPILFRITDGSTAKDLTFFDSAGDDMQSVDAIEYNVTQLRLATGVIVLIDPLQLDPVRHELTRRGFTALPPKSDQLEASNVLARFLAYFERHALPAGEKPTTPFAFVLSKLDCIEPLLPPNSPLLKPSKLIKASGPTSAELDEEELDKLSEHVTGLIQTWDPPLYAMIMNNFDTYRCFAVSALGSNPVSSTIPDVKPKRVEDPMLWILRELDII